MIIDLKTNLKSLKYGQDQPGGGSSNQPYIQVTADTFGKGLNVLNIAGVTDTIRIGKFLADTSKGPMFIAKQVGLQLSNPRLEQLANPITNNSSGLLGLINKGINAVNSALGPTRIYNLGVNTLAQIPLTGLDQHIVRHGLTPIITDQSKYAYIVKQNDIEGANRLVGLTNNLLLNPSNLIIDSYIGGPNSILGIGSTTIKRYDITSDVLRNASLLSLGNANLSLGLKVDFSKLHPITDLYSKTPTYTSASLTDGSTHSDLTIGGHYTNDKTIIGNNVNTLVAASTNLSTGSILIVDSSNPLIRSKINNIGSNIKYTNTPISYKNTYGETITIKKTWATGNREVRVGSGRKDEMNLFSLFTKYAGDSTTSGGVVLINGQKHSIRDFVKFRIEAVDNNDPTKFVGMAFRAYLSGLSDNYSPEWNEIKYVGRGDRFENYTGVERMISFRFKIAALSRDEMMPIYQKLNYLASNTAPDYNNNLMRAPLIRLTLGNYLIKQPGRLGALTFTIPDDSPWEIAIDEPEQGSDVRMYELPHIIEVSISFRPFHNFLPQKSSFSPFILDKTAERGDPRNPWLNKYIPKTYSQQELVQMKATDTYKSS